LMQHLSLSVSVSVALHSVSFASRCTSPAPAFLAYHFPFALSVLCATRAGWLFRFSRSTTTIVTCPCPCSILPLPAAIQHTAVLSPSLMLFSLFCSPSLLTPFAQHFAIRRGGRGGASYDLQFPFAAACIAALVAWLPRRGGLLATFGVAQTGIASRLRRSSRTQLASLGEGVGVGVGVGAMCVQGPRPLPGVDTSRISFEKVHTQEPAGERERNSKGKFSSCIRTGIKVYLFIVTRECERSAAAAAAAAGKVARGTSCLAMQPLEIDHATCNSLNSFGC
ncbi:Hypothetical predicted protein, partial [Drosophila guanche]